MRAERWLAILPRGTCRNRVLKKKTVAYIQPAAASSNHHWFAMTCSSVVRPSCRVFCLLFWGLMVSVAVQPTRGGDWSQILGPHRNGVAVGEKLAATWPQGGPREKWTYKLGQGYAGPAVVGKRVIVFHRVGNVERVEAIDATSGQQVWKRDFDATYGGGVNSDTGPRCVPLVHQGRVYVYGASGDLHCVSLQDGQPIWSRETYRDYQGDEGYFGAGTTPIAIGNHLIVNVGGRKQAGIVAFALKDGKSVWLQDGERASYASPTKATINGRDYAVFVTRLNALAIDAQTGKLLFRFPFGQRGPTVNAATPLIVDGNKLFVSSSYGVGANFSELTATGAKPIWANDETLSSQYTTAVYDQGYFYGTHGREDIGAVELRCVEAATGRVQWSTTNGGVAHVILADGKLVILRADGRLVLATATPEKFERLASATVGNGVTRAIPALSNGHLYLRDGQGAGGTLYCFDLGK